MSRKVYVSDITMALQEGENSNRLSFRQKIELAKLLDRLNVSVIETGMLVNGKQDYLLVKSIASSLRSSALSVCVDINDETSVETIWSCLQEAVHPRLQVSVPVSTVQMEYLCHKKPDAVKELVERMVKACAALCSDVEFVAEDFGRSEKTFLLDVVKTATDNGATTVTFYDTAGTLLDSEAYELVSTMRQSLPEGVKLGVRCSNEMYMADACAVAAVRAGADEVKVSAYGNTTTSLKRFAKILSVKSVECDAYSDVKLTEMQRTMEQIKALCVPKSARGQGLEVRGERLEVRGVEGSELLLTSHDDRETVFAIMEKLGYELDDDDKEKVYDAFLSLASKSEAVEAKELDAIVASIAFQAPPTYRLESYLINSGNVITATCHLRLIKDENVMECACLGDGPVDAAFHAIEQLVGNQYELDDFQIQSVTEGREAMGRAVVRLRHEGKVYSGCGISRDIVGSSIMAYLSAVNKIVNEDL